MEGFIPVGRVYPFARSQDNIKNRSKIILIFFVLATVYLGRSKITRKDPFHSVAFALKVFGYRVGQLVCQKTKKYLQ